jgi:hypothetical protein
MSMRAIIQAGSFQARVRVPVAVHINNSSAIDRDVARLWGHERAEPIELEVRSYQ